MKKKTADRKKPVLPGPERIDPSITSMLQENETIVRAARIHDGIFWKGSVVFLLSVPLVIKLFNLGAFLMFVSIIMLSFAYLTRHYLVLVLTDRRVLIRHGIVHLDVVQIRLNRIESVETLRTLPGRILGYATVVITGTGSRVTSIPYIAEASAFRNELDARLFAEDDKGGGGAA